MHFALFAFLFCIGHASAQTTTFSYTGAVQNYTVPIGVSNISVDVMGAQGGSSYYGYAGGLGGRVQATLAVSPGQVLQVYVGQRGSAATVTLPGNAGGWNGGGQGTAYGGAGGGASDIRIPPYGIADRIVVAGAGAGGAQSCVDIGAAAGGTSGDNGNYCGGYTTADCGGGGTQTAGGSGATSGGAIAGSLGAGGAAAHGGYFYYGFFGTYYRYYYYNGSGGGGGYYGGGGGQNGSGGGGSSYPTTGATTTYASAVTNTGAFQSGDGQVSITPLCSLGFDYGSPQSLPVCFASTPVSLNNLLKASNTTGGTITYTVVSGPSHGTLTGFPVSAPGGTSSMPAGTYYQPAYSYSGADAFTVQASDGTCTVTTVINVTVAGILPAPVSVIGGGGYCSGGSGVTVGLSGSAVGVSYQLYQGSTAVSGLVPGVGMAFNFGLETTAGTYTAVAFNTTTGCSNNMTGSATVIVYPLPNIYTVTGGGSYCSGGNGVTIGVSNSDIGINYQLYRSGLPLVGVVVAGTGSAVSFPLQTVSGTYTVVAKNASFTGCTQNMTGSATVSVSALPNAYNVTGTGSYCVGGTGTAVGLSNSDPGVNYQLYSGSTAIGSPVAGTGSAISFGLQTAGTYTVKATDATSGCVNTMTGSAAITTTALPSVYSMTGGGSFCIGGAGVPVGLNTSTGGISYQLYNGTTAVGSPVTGTGTPIAFGLQTTPGTYTVVATNPATGCVSNMSGAAVVSTIALPTAYTVTGGGAYCTGGTGVHVGLSSSATGVSYQLYLGSTATGSPLAGTGSSLDFGIKTTAGVYTVTASVTGTYCTSSMTGSATVSVNLLPAVYTMTGGGSFCSGGTGVSVGLSGSQSGVNYQLYRGATSVGSPVAGTGSAISFGLQTTPGIYTAVATNSTTGCVSNMTGSATISTIALPTVFSVTGGGGYCTGSGGVVIGLSGSQAAVNYQLYLGSATSGSPIPGSGGSLNFGVHTTAGTYTVVATAITGSCTSNMTGSAIVTVNPLPTVYSLTGGGSYCTGGAGVSIGLGGSDIGINYQLLRGTTLVGSAVAGTGSAITFPNQTTAGTYTVAATNASTSCSSNMSGSAAVTINAAPVAVAMTGGGAYCSGGTGIHIGLAASVGGTSYQLWLGSTAVGSPVSGVGSSLDFGLQTTAGTYTATATNTAGCTTTMTGSETVYVNSLPATFTVTGGGSLCTGSAGVHIGLSGSATGITYKLIRSGSTAASLGGTGSTLDFGLFTTAGTYTVTAISTGTGCTATMSGSAAVTVNPVPTVSGSLFTLAPGSTTTLTGSISGGTWTSGTPTVATVGGSTGLVTGVAIGTTTITYTLTTGCWGSHLFYVTATGRRDNPSGITSMTEYNMGNITVTPNPNHGTFTIKGSSGTISDQQVSIQVTNMLGEVVYNNKITMVNGEINETIQLAGNIANGMYLLSLRSGGDTKVVHIVVEQ